MIEREIHYKIVEEGRDYIVKASSNGKDNKVNITFTNYHTGEFKEVSTELSKPFDGSDEHLEDVLQFLYKEEFFS